MTQNNDHDFQQFRGAFDDAMIPDAAFKSKMEKLLQAEKPVEAERSSTVFASPPNESSATVVPTTRRSHPLMIAAAVLTVFAVAVASVWVLSGDVLEGDYASAPSGIATLPADAPGTPGPDVTLQPHLLTEIPAGSYLFGIYGDVLITSQWIPDDTEYGRTDVTAINRKTGETLWEREGFDFQQPVYSEETIVSLRWHSDDESIRGVGYQSLVAVDAITGDTLWEHDLPKGEHPELPYDRTVPVIIDDVVAVADTSGTIRAWNLRTGDLQWEEPFNVGEGFPIEMHVGTDEIVHGSFHAVALTTWNNQLILANGDGLIMEVDPATGTITRDFRPDFLSNDDVPANYVRLDPLPDGLLLTIVPNNYEGMNAGLYAINPSSGEVIWQLPTEGYFGVSTRVSNDGSIAWASHTWESTNWLLRLLGNHGHSTLQIVWIDGTNGEAILTTERGRVDAVYPVVTDGEYACTQLDEFVCFDRNGTRHIVESERIGEPVLEDGVLYYSNGNGIFTVTLP